MVEDIKSVSEFKKQTREVFAQLHRTGRPIVVTVNGRPDVVLLDAAVFERKLKAPARPGSPSGPFGVAKKYRVEITRTAERDVASIRAFIARDNPTAAVAWLNAVERNISSPERWPMRCPVIPEAPDLGAEYRQLINEPYRTIFRITASRVIIVRVIHGAQLLNLDVLGT